MSASPFHHPNAALLQAAAAGQLSPAISRIIDAHARLCARCSAMMAKVETVSAAAFEDEAGEAMAANALERVLAALDAPAPREVQLHDTLSALPKEVHDVVAPAQGKIAWYTGGPGLRILDLALPATAKGETFQVFRIEPGYGPPRHTHGGQEFTLVLTGAFKDETGVYKAGDIAIGDENVTHRPVAEPGEVCYALAVTTAPLKFKGPLGVLQRVLNFGRS